VATTRWRIARDEELERYYLFIFQSLVYLELGVSEKLGHGEMLVPLIKLMLPIWKKTQHTSYVSYLTEFLIRIETEYSVELV
jgi:hypothetical protein